MQIFNTPYGVWYNGGLASSYFEIRSLAFTNHHIAGYTNNQSISASSGVVISHCLFLENHPQHAGNGLHGSEGTQTTSTIGIDLSPGIAQTNDWIVSNTASVGAHRGVNIGGAFGAGNAVFRNGLVLASYYSGMVATDKADSTVTNAHIATNACMGDAWFAHCEGNYDALGDGTSDE